MAAIKNVAIAGVSVITCKNLLQLYPKTSQAAGDLGEPVLKALVNSGKFNVTVLVRSASKNSFPLPVEVIEVDFTSVESLTKALNGQDALVSTVGISGLEGQTIMIDACVAAGVSRFLPSEFGSDLDNPMVKALPVFGYKVAVNKYAEEKARENPEFFLHKDSQCCVPRLGPGAFIHLRFEIWQAANLRQRRSTIQRHNTGNRRPGGRGRSE